jgi:hypothetical protein
LLADETKPTEIAALRRFTHTGRPLGTAAFVTELERATRRPLAARKRGRRPQRPTDADQTEIEFAA